MNYSGAASGPNTSLFGIVLSREATALLAEVERDYGKPVRQEWLRADDPMPGKSAVGDDGTPIISVHPVDGKALDVIVHELYHFRLRTRGYPAILWSFPQDLDIPSNRAAFAQLTMQLWDPILHHVFYPEVRKWGIDPGATFERLMGQSLQDGVLGRDFPGMDRGAAALYHFKVRLELNDRTLLRQIVELLARTQAPGVKLGEQLVEIVVRAAPASPAEAITALVECLNLFYRGQWLFEQRQWTSRQLGLHTQRLATIEIKRAP